MHDSNANLKQHVVGTTAGNEKYPCGNDINQRKKHHKTGKTKRKIIVVGIFLSVMFPYPAVKPQRDMKQLKHYKQGIRTNEGHQYSTVTI